MARGGGAGAEGAGRAKVDEGVLIVAGCLSAIEH